MSWVTSTYKYHVLPLCELKVCDTSHRKPRSRHRVGNTTLAPIFAKRPPLGPNSPTVSRHHPAKALPMLPAQRVFRRFHRPHACCGKSRWWRSVEWQDLSKHHGSEIRREARCLKQQHLLIWVQKKQAWNKNPRDLVLFMIMSVPFRVYYVTIFISGPQFENTDVHTVCSEIYIYIYMPKYMHNWCL